MEAIEVRDNDGNVLWATSANYVDNKSNVPSPRLTQRYTVSEIGGNLKSLEIIFYGEWNEETKTVPVSANFNV